MRESVGSKIRSKYQNYLELNVPPREDELLKPMILLILPFYIIIANIVEHWKDRNFYINID